MNDTFAHQGLSRAEAQKRMREYGPNALPASPPVSLWLRFIRQFQSPLIYILLFAVVVDMFIWISEGARGLPIETIAIAIILLLNAGLGVYQESKSEAALARLRELAAPLVWVLRDGKLRHLSDDELVPGDVIRLESGDRVPADGRLLEAEGVLFDESVLTGESVPVEKENDQEVFSGTLLVRGKAWIEVLRTGQQSALGQLAVMLGGIEAEPTPLERRLEHFGGQIARVVLILTVLIAVGGLLIEGLERIGHVLLFAVALAVAAVPEGLPAVLTLTLALGVERMARRKAVVRRLSAVEALGSVTAIATDKTGTLTENRMFVRELDSPDPNRALLAMALANDAEDEAEVGDPLELALLAYLHEHKPELQQQRNSYERHSALPFDSTWKYMRVTVQTPTGLISYLKGAPEVMLSRSRMTDAERQIWREKAEAYASGGFRVLSLGWCAGESDKNIEFLGHVLLWDPPRPEVPDAIRRARAAGIRVLMVTGDHPATALTVASEVGIPPGRVLTGDELASLPAETLLRAVRETNVFARVAPAHKLRLVESLRETGDIIAMTGDGVNDAPALKRADVGVAMGERGSDVSREVADLVLLDDNFSTIVAAIDEGRNIYENIQKFIRFLFSTNLAELLIVVMGAFGSFVLGLHDNDGSLLLPLTAIQLLWVNIITDGPPALALALDHDPGVMQQSPRDPHAPLLDRDSLRFILVTGCLKAIIGGLIMIMLPRYGFSLMETRTAVFLHTSIGQLFYTWPARRINTPPQFNPALLLTVVLGAGLQLLTVLLPPLRVLLGLHTVTGSLLAIVGAAILFNWGTAELWARIAHPASK